PELLLPDLSLLAQFVSQNPEIVRQYAPRHLQGAVLKAFRTHGASEEFIFKDRHARFSLGSPVLRLGKVFILHGLAQSTRITGTEPGKCPALLCLTAAGKASI